MSGLRIAEFKKPRSIIVDQARVDSAYGPKSSIMLQTGASSFSKSGFTIEVKGLSRDSLMSGAFVVLPVQVKWASCAGHGAAVNSYPKLNEEGKDDGDWTGQSGYKSFDDLSIRPNAFKCIRNATLSINGSSFSTRVDGYYTAMTKLFCDGRVEEITGCAYERYPHSNSGDPNQVLVQKGARERAMTLNRRGRIKSVDYTVAPQGGAAAYIKEVIWEYDIKFPLWFGPFTHLGFPGLSGFDGQSVSAIPFISDLVIECTFTDDPIMDMFVAPSNTLSNQLGVQNPKGVDRAIVAGREINSQAMWDAGDFSGDGIEGKAGAHFGLLRPYLAYSFAEPDSDKMQMSSIYTLPSYRFITYEDRKVIPAQPLGGGARSKTVQISFPFIRLSNISSLYCCFAEDDRVDNGTGIAARSGKFAKSIYDARRRGLATSNITCPIKWDTVVVQMSTSSSVLSNFVDNVITPQRQYELYKKYSGNAEQLTYEDWLESSQMLLFSAEELQGIGAFANSYQSLTLSVRFEVYRTAADTKIRPGDMQKDYQAVASVGVDPTKAMKGEEIPRALIGRLICIEPELVSISEGALSVEQVKLSQQEIHSQLMGGAPEVEDANRLDELAR